MLSTAYALAENADSFVSVKFAKYTTCLFLWSGSCEIVISCIPNLKLILLVGPLELRGSVIFFLYPLGDLPSKFSHTTTSEDGLRFLKSKRHVIKHIFAVEVPVNRERKIHFFYRYLTFTFISGHMLETRVR